MKLLKKLTLILFVGLLLFSCKKDGDEIKVEELIIGTWKLTSEIDQDGVEWVEEEDCDIFLIFTKTSVTIKDFTDYEDEHEENCLSVAEIEGPFPYILDEKTISIILEGEENSVIDYIELTATTFKMKYEEVYEGVVYSEITTFTKQ